MSKPDGGKRPLMARSSPLSDGEVVTLLIGLALELAALHAAGKTYGSLHPVHVSVDARGRPHVERVESTNAWSEADDVMAVLRLGCSLSSIGGSLHQALVARSRVGSQTIEALLHFLLEAGTPKPIRRCS
jgi:hypothetical protein